ARPRRGARPQARGDDRRRGLLAHPSRHGRRAGAVRRLHRSQRAGGRRARAHVRPAHGRRRDGLRRRRRRRRGGAAEPRRGGEGALPDRERARPPRAPAVPGRASRRRRAGGVPAPAPRLHHPAAPRAVHAGLPRRPPDARRVPDVRGRSAGARAGPGLTAPADPPTRRNLMTAPVRDLDAPVVEVRDLRKSYGDVIALDGLDLEIGRGEVHGFLGPTGAGKSTTIRILLGLLRHDGGTARVLGGDPWTDAVALHRRLAYVPGDVELWPNLTGGEAMDLLARLRGGTDAARRDELCERFDLDPR